MQQQGETFEELIRKLKAPKLTEQQAELINMQLQLVSFNKELSGAYKEKSSTSKLKELKALTKAPLKKLGYHKGRNNKATLQGKNSLSLDEIEELQGGKAGYIKLDETKLKLNKAPSKSDMYGCKKGFIIGESLDRIYTKIVVCGKENCKYCSMDLSIAHNRRMRRAKKYLKQFNQFSYLVITFPPEIRALMLQEGKGAFLDFKTFIKRSLKGGYTYREYKRGKEGESILYSKKYAGIQKGVMRWHWCGEDYKEFHPHLNILMESGYWTEKRIENIKKRVAAWYKKRYKLEKVRKPVCHYGYTKSKYKAKHWLRYILRATARNVEEGRILNILHNFRNTTYFGNFEKAQESEENLEEKAFNGKDILTGENINWLGMIPTSVWWNYYQYQARTPESYNQRIKRDLAIRGKYLAPKLIQVRKPNKINLLESFVRLRARKIPEQLGIFINEKSELFACGEQISLNLRLSNGEYESKSIGYELTLNRGDNFSPT